MAVNRSDPDAVAAAASDRAVRRTPRSTDKDDEPESSKLSTHPGRAITSTGVVELPDVPQGELDMPPEEVARRAFNHGALLDPATRGTALTELTARSHVSDTPTGKALRQILDNADRAIDILSLVGYQQLRHLRANGIALSRIAKDLGINVNDLTAFMSQAPTAAEDAMIDEEAYADTKANELLEILEDAKPTSNLDTDVFKVRMNLLLEMNKRLSHKWAQRSDEEIVARMPTLNINLTTMAPTARMIQQQNDIKPEGARGSHPPESQQSLPTATGGTDSIDYPAVDDDLPVVTPIQLVDPEEQ